MVSNQNSPPSIDPVDNDTLIGTFKTVLRKFLQGGVDDMLPASVVAFDRAKNRVTVQPMIMILSTLGEQKQRAQVQNLPVLQIGGGNFVLNFPLKPGDLGWIKASDRDISLFLQSYKQAPPNTLRMHNFSDAIFIPNIMTGFTIDGEDTDNAVLQTLDGSVRISLFPDKVKITGNLVVDGSINATGDILAGSISLKTHVHGGVQPGSGDTGAPV